MCGNGTLDPGEECDPPNVEICNNLIDDDGDSLIDCLDPDCAPLTMPTCGSLCEIVPPCQLIERDPAVIRFGAPGDLDRLSIHGRFALQSPIDVPIEGFGIVMSNANGVIMRAEAPGDLFVRRRGGKGAMKMRDRGARQGQPVADGLEVVTIRLRQIQGVQYLVFRLRAYADLSAATLPLMSTQVVVGNDAGTLSADWTETRRGWTLHQRDFH